MVGEQSNDMINKAEGVDLAEHIFLNEFLG